VALQTFASSGQRLDTGFTNSLRTMKVAQKTFGPGSRTVGHFPCLSREMPSALVVEVLVAVE
jgi:hypothetical protein